LREVVARQKVGTDAVVESNVTVICRSHQGDLETARVVEVEVELAGLLLVLGFGSRADDSLELVEAECDDGSVGGDDRADRSAGAPVTGVVALVDGDSVWRSVASGQLGGCREGDGWEEGDGGELHDD